MINSSTYGLSYNYAPAVVVDGGIFKMLYCSTGADPGVLGVRSFDYLRYSESTDGRMWSRPDLIFAATNGTEEQATCDPSVVYYQAPGDAQPYWYLFYTGNREHNGSIVFVARGPTITGPYHKWTYRGTWEMNPPDPKPIIEQTNPMAPWSGRQEPDCYGAGQTSVAVRNGQLHLWWTDDTVFPYGHPNGDQSALGCQAAPRLIHAISTNPTSFPSRLITTEPTPLGNVDLPMQSVDVKWDASFGMWVMYYAGYGQTVDAGFSRRFSYDGNHWSTEDLMCDTNCFPNHANNLGITGTPLGEMVQGNRGLAIFAAPGVPNANGNVPTDWDLYGWAINPAGNLWNQIEWAYQYTGTNNYTAAAADFDGDGMSDRAAISPSADWHVLPSGSGNMGFASGTNWPGTAGRSLVIGDWEGDGRADRAVVDQFQYSTAPTWLALTSSGGSPGFPWGWTWPGTNGFTLAVGDYDGDGRSDRAVVSTQNATPQWFVLTSSGASPGFSWAWSWPGTQGFQLALGDYDGDGKTDRAAVSMSQSTPAWFVYPSSGASIAFPWGWTWPGTSNFKLALGDFDGDGKTDRAAVNPATGSWLAFASTGNQANIEFPWGWQLMNWQSHFKIVIGDYDGDGKDDAAAVDELSGRWFIRPSSHFRVF